MIENSVLLQKVKNLPKLPGVYQFFNSSKKVIYVGKAKNLRSRVSSYFNTSVNSPKTLALVNKIADLQVIITNSEVEALVLENNLIKQFQPRYNINLKDDKSYPFIKVTNEPFPRIFTTRNVERDGSKYFGPYTDVKSMKSSLQLISRLFKIRSCKYYFDENIIKQKKIKLCLDYHIKKCDGPCEGLISSSDYQLIIDSVIKLLRGKTQELINDLKNEMNAAAAKMQFEKAAEIRDKINQLDVYTKKQKVVTNDFSNKDVITIETEDKDIAVSILNIRNGILIGKNQFHYTYESIQAFDEIYTTVIRKYYNEFTDFPDEIITEVEPAEFDLLKIWFEEELHHKIKFIVPQRESNSKSLLQMCKLNSKLFLNEILLQKFKKQGNIPHVLNSLKRDLRLNKIPRRIECFDISHLQGTDTVGSMVVFVNGRPAKSEYRRYIIKSVKGVDDFESMREVITRRFSKLSEEPSEYPDLIIIDGGIGQLSAAVEILEKFNLQNLPIISLAKRLEEIYYPKISEPQSIPKTSSSLKLIQHLRDEAHRFAITFHREKRSKRTFTSELLNIKGIGNKITETLLKEFDSIDAIKNSSFEKLVTLIGNAKAKLIFEYFNNKN